MTIVGRISQGDREVCLEVGIVVPHQGGHSIAESYIP